MSCDPDSYRAGIRRGRAIERRRLAKMLLRVRGLLLKVLPLVEDGKLREKVDAMLAILGGKG